MSSGTAVTLDPTLNYVVFVTAIWVTNSSPSGLRRYVGVVQNNTLTQLYNASSGTTNFSITYNTTTYALKVTAPGHYQACFKLVTIRDGNVTE